MKLKYIICLVVVLNFLSCENSKVAKRSSDTTEATSTDLQVDHFNIWVENPGMAKKQLTDIGFTSVPDSLSQIHKGQGTAGRYFNFLNGYLELIFVYDQNEFESNNKINGSLDFHERASFKENKASPFSIALKVKDYNVEKIPFEKVKYHQEWMEANSNIFAAKSSKTRLKEPSVFVVYPQIESDVFETLDDLKTIPEEYSIWREFFKHPNGAKKVTNIRITSTGVDLKSETIQAINGISNLTVSQGEEHLMELFFDNNIQGKSFDLRPQLPLKIYL